MATKQQQVTAAPAPQAPVAPAGAVRVNAYGYPLGITRAANALGLAAMQNRANILAQGLLAGTYGNAQGGGTPAPGTTYAGAYQHYTASVAWVASTVAANPALATPAVQAWLAQHHAPTRKKLGNTAA